MRYLYILLAIGFSFAASAQRKQDRHADPDTSGKQVIRLRCQSSITKGQPPLYILDGFPVKLTDLSKLDVNSIENIQVMKDVTASVLYGSAAANGVVIINTKCKLEFIFQDVEGKQMVGSATVKLFSTELRDTLMYAADSSGFLTINNVKRGRDYGVLVSAVGYEDWRMPYTPRGGVDEIHVAMTRNYKYGPDVVVSAMGYYKCGRRGVCCFGRYEAATVSQANVATEKAVLTKCYPNPLSRGSTLHVEFRTKQSGASTLRMLNAGGALVSSQQVSLIEGTNRVDIPTDSRFVPGIYFVILYDAQQQPVIKQKVVIQ